MPSADNGGGSVQRSCVRWRAAINRGMPSAENGSRVQHALAAGLLGAMFVLAGGAALRESVTVDEVPHIAAGLSYVQRLDLRLNPEHPPLAKIMAGVALAVHGTRADYGSRFWRFADDFGTAKATEWMFGDAIVGRWNDGKTTLLWARFPMLLLMLVLGWMVYRYGSALGGEWGGLLCLAAYVTTPAFLAFGPLVITDVAATLFPLLALWRLGAMWAEPSWRNSLLFGLAAGGALLSKFTGLLLIPVVPVLLVQARKEHTSWRRVRLRGAVRGFLVAALVVWSVYLVFSWNGSGDVLEGMGSGPGAAWRRRLLLPLLLYTRGVRLMLEAGSRPAYLLGHHYAQGVPYYFPVVFGLKSTLGFLLLLLLTGVAGLLVRTRGVAVITGQFSPHWRALQAGFLVFLTVCLSSRLNISIRHFLMPVVLLILMLAPLPRMLGALPRTRLLQGVVAALAVSCFVSILQAYPYFFPFVNSLAMGNPAYELVNDSNVTWNEGLPAVERFAEEQHLAKIRLDWASLSDPALVVPQAQSWDCQTPAEGDAGHWVAVTAVSILENHNCGYLLKYAGRALAGGAFYVFKLPVAIPAAGKPGGPPRAAERRSMWDEAANLRDWSVNMERHPDEFPKPRGSAAQ